MEAQHAEHAEHHEHAAQGVEARETLTVRPNGSPMTLTGPDWCGCGRRDVGLVFIGRPALACCGCGRIRFEVTGAFTVQVRRVA